MKSSIAIIAAYLILTNMGCRKEPVEPVESVTKINVIVNPVNDTTKITKEVYSPGKIIVENLIWIFPWYNSLEVKNFDKMIPAIAIFKVFIKRVGSTQWIEVPLFTDEYSTTEYEYFVEKRPDGAGMYRFGSLYIFYYGRDVEDFPSVKIEY